jgi:DNA topoisomerase-2
MASGGVFEWLSGQEAVLRRPDAYVGAIDAVEEEAQVLTAEGNLITIQYCLSPILMKIFDEVLVNAIDSATRDPMLRSICCTFDAATGGITMENDGMGIPIVEFQQTKRLVPSVVFSELHAGSNFQDGEQRLTGGRNGVGVSCTNIWSSFFQVDVWDTKKRFTQVFEKNLTIVHDPVVVDKRDKRGLVRVHFIPDYQRLSVDLVGLAPVLEDLMRTRCAEGSVCARADVTVSFQGQRLFNSPANFMRLLCGSDSVFTDNCGTSLGAGCDFVLGMRERGKDFYGFVNSVRCDHGTLCAAARDKLLRLIAEVVRKKSAVVVRAQTVRDVVAVMCVARIVNPRFTSQAKDSLASSAKDFGFVLEFSPRVASKLQRTGIIEEIIRREQERELSTCLKKTLVPKSRDILIEKYDAALDVRKDPAGCTLILTEGDSAKALVVAGLSAIGREKFGIFPLRGVPLNVTNMQTTKVLLNLEISNVFKILNVGPFSDGHGLRYGKIAICSDQERMRAEAAFFFIVKGQRRLTHLRAHHQLPLRASAGDRACAQRLPAEDRNPAYPRLAQAPIRC